MDSKPTLRIWGRPTSFNVQKVLWLVNELDIEYEHILAGEQFGVCNTPEFRTLNPHARIPTITWQGQPVWESHAILRFLAAEVQRKPFWQPSALVRSQSDRWMDWGQTVLETDLMLGVFWGLVRTPEPVRDLAMVRTKVARCAGHYSLLEEAMGSFPYLTGQEISLADIAVGTTLYRYFTMDIERPKLPRIERWYRHLSERPHYRKWVMVSYDDLRGRAPG